MLNNRSKHVSVCICTYRRPQMLKRLLQTLEKQETEGLFTFSIVVADNDGQRSAEALVSDFAASAAIPVTYCAEPQQNISLARNKAIANATGDFIAFIDDDEFPGDRWLLTLFQACGKYGADGVLGPVKCHFDQDPPKWVIKGKFYERPTYPTGLVIDWAKGRTGNVLLKRQIFEGEDAAFSPEFHRSGDQEFFRTMIAKGHVFIWCDEAVAYEVVPPIRWTRTFMLKRALLRGTIGMQFPTMTRWQRIAKAVIAVPAYTIALPFSLALGHHRFMALLIRLCDHSASLLTFVGIKPVRSQLITD
ncbi:MAG TPA: glycosyltransferase family 2 protein [Terriglobales bacterium]|nr:glycosyltransferase family 2 protein [Terriglobales bacterium]